MKPPEDFNGLMDEIQKLQTEARVRAAVLPPTDATTIITELLNETEPMVEELRRTFPEAMEACEEFRQQCESKIEESKANVAKAEETAAAIKPRSEILKDLTPIATTLPAGLSLQFGQELQQRYVPVIEANDERQLPGAAWQDWTVS